MESIISTQSPSLDKLGTLLWEAGLSEELVAQLVCCQSSVVLLLPGRQAGAESLSTTDLPGTGSQYSSRADPRSQIEKEQSSNLPVPQFQTRVMSLLSSMEQRLTAMESTSKSPP